jgi:endonuclease G
MKAHNAPTWSGLEEQCRAWAKQLGSVCVVVGPVYNNPSQARHIQDRRTEEPLDIAFADTLFCVVIGTRQGQTAAIGFLMPHVTAKFSFKDKAVPIDRIEQATGINFMPLLGEPNTLEEVVDQRWLNN